MNIKIADIEVEVERKHIKNLHLYVLPPDGRVRATVPYKLKDSEIERFITEKLCWIEAKRKLYQSRPVRPEHKYISGEIVPVWGRDYVLAVENGTRSRVEQDGNTLCLFVKGGGTEESRTHIINDWYRVQLEAAIPAAAVKYEKITGVFANEWHIRNMKTRWGSCNTRDKRICLNLRLAKKPQECLEYVVVHELTHLLERGHNARFYGYMDRFMPGWRAIKAELNTAADYTDD